MKSRKAGGKHSAQSTGVGSVEYSLITGMMVVMLLVPFTLESEEDPRSVMRRIIDAVQYEQGGYMYAASLSTLPRQDGWLSGEDPEEGGGPYGGGGGGTGSGGPVGVPDDGIPGTGNPPGNGDGIDVGGGVGEVPGQPDGGGDGPGGNGSIPPVGEPGGPGGPGNPTSGLEDISPGEPDPGDIPLVGAPGGPPDTGLPSPPAYPGDPEGPGSDLWPGDDGYSNGSPAQCAASDLPEPGFFPTSGTASQYQAAYRQRWSGVAQPAGLPSTHVGNPINVVTGNKYQQETDLGLLPDGLSFVRHYNSRTTWKGSLGHGWRHGFEVTLQDRGNSIVLWQADGRRIDFSFLERDQHGIRHYRAVQHQDDELTRGDFYRWRWANGGEVVFSKNGRLYSQTDPAGRLLVFDYSASGRLRHIVDAENRRITLRYDRHGRLSGMTDPGQKSFHYDYDERGNLARVRYPDNTQRVYHYEDRNDPHNLTGISLSSASRLEGEGQVRIASWAYDAQDRGILSSHADGVGRVTLTYQHARTLVTDSQGRVSSYMISSAGGIPFVKAIHGPGCSSCGSGDVEYKFNRAMQVTQLKRRGGPSTRYDYDALGRLTGIRSENESGGEFELAGFRYDGDTGRILEMRSPSVRPGQWRRIVMDYDTDGRPEVATETGFAPRPDGSFVPISRQQTFGYGSHGRLSSVDGYREDVADMLRVVAGASGPEYRFADGGALSVSGKDAYGRIARIQIDRDRVLHIGYGPTGRIESLSNDVAALRLRYDGYGQLEGMVLNGEEVQIAPSGTDRFVNSPRTRQEYLKLPVPVLRLADSRGVTTRYGIDDFGRKVFVDSPDSGITRYEYDRAGNLIGVVDGAGEAAGFKLDIAGRLRHATVGRQDIQASEKLLPDGRRILSVRSSGHAEKVMRDQAGRVLQRTQAFNGRRYTTRYRYNDAGRLDERILPDGRVLVFHYHNSGKDRSELAGVFIKRRFGRDNPLITGLNDEPADSNESDYAAFNGIVTTIRRRERGALQGMTISGLHDFDYIQDAAGRITGINDHGLIAQRYRYDRKGRLDFALTPSALYGYRYDRNGNRTRRVVNGGHTGFDYATDSNRLARMSLPVPAWRAPLKMHVASLTFPDGLADTSASTDARPISVRHNARGDIEQQGELRIAYTANGQPEHVWRGEAQIASYHYNHRAERIGKTLHNSPSPRAGDGREEGVFGYVYENHSLSAEINAAGNIARQYLYLGHCPAIILERDRTYATHCNHLGAPIAVTDANQTVIWRADYAPFGEADVDEDPDGDGQGFTLNIRLPGQYYDAETGLHYNYRRYYDPGTGRYISSDPLGLAAGPNTYVYVANDPVNHVDPLGLLLFAFDGTGNSDTDPTDAHTNVVKFRDAYLGDPDELMVRPGAGHGERWYYITGPGTEDRRSGVSGGGPDSASGSTVGRRILKMFSYLIDHLEWMNQNDVRSATLNLDIVGFSRGAASARIYANLVDAFLSDEETFIVNNDTNDVATFRGSNIDRAREYMLESCIDVSLRFLGLWDTVPHLGGVEYNDSIESYGDEGDAYLAVPDRVQYVAHAVSVNENRAIFDLMSISNSPRVESNKRVEKGFVGAHADIGGGYTNSDLSDVALMWVVQQASAVDLEIDMGFLSDERADIVSKPTVNDPVYNAPRYVPDNAYYPGRYVRYLDYGDRTDVVQKEWRGSKQNLGFDESIAFLEENIYQDTLIIDDGLDTTTLKKTNGKYLYKKWLKDNYNLEVEICDRC